MSSVPYPLPPSHPHHRHRCLPGTSYTTALRSDAPEEAGAALGTTSSMFAEAHAGGDKQQPSTLDKLHHTHVHAMVNEKKRFEQLRQTLVGDRTALKALQARSLRDLDDAEMQRMFHLETAVADAEQALAKFDRNGPFTDYFMETSDILFEYYENLDQISKGTDARRKRSLQSYASTNPSDKPTVIDFFRKKAAEAANGAVTDAAAKGSEHGGSEHGGDGGGRGGLSEDEGPDGSDGSDGSGDEGGYGSENEVGATASKGKAPRGTKRCQGTGADTGPDTGADADDDADDARPPSPPTYQSRQVLLNKYLEKTDPTFVPTYDNTYEALDTDDCPDCGTERFLVHYEATLVCPNPACARADVILIDSYKPSYKDAPREGASYYSYKRINHFNEWLMQFQAKETTDIPDDVYHKIYVELKKERIENMAHITPAKMKEILKRLKLNKYYEHIPHITNRINGQPAPVMDRATEEKLRSMFKQIQSSFAKHCPSERKNFLSYSYVLHKFCQLLSLDDFLVCFPLLKSREKLHQQDLIWEKICRDLRWEFIKSV